MIPIKLNHIIILGIILVFTIGSAAFAAEPSQILLTWQNDPHTTMTISFRTDTEVPAFVYFSEDHEAELEDFTKIPVQTSTFDETSAFIHSAELDGLKPGTEYVAFVSTEEHKSEPFTFRTAPKEPEEIIFLAGGDSRTNRDERRMINELAAEQKPDFVLFGGDFIENPLAEDEWDDWFDDWHELMITEEGRRIPIVPVIGNHEVTGGGYNQDKEAAPFYYNRFFLPGNEKYYVLEYGPLTLLNLDSGHTASIDGEQKDWLKQTLRQYRGSQWIIAQYHVPGFSSSREFGHRGVSPDIAIAEEIRRHWGPLFEKYGVDAVHENHDHAYKQTHPIAGIGQLYHRLDRMIDLAIKRAEEDFDPEESYSPWVNPELQKLSRGDWQDAGFKTFTEGLYSLFYNQALYAKQSGDLTPETVYRSFGDTVMFQQFWREIGFEDGYDFLIDEEKGVYYFGDGGWGAPLREVRDTETHWWINEAETVYNFFLFTLSPDNNTLTIEPVLIEGEGTPVIISK